MPYFDGDGLLRKYGTEKVIPTTGGEYALPGELREFEFTIDLTTLTTSPTIINDVTFMPASMFVEEVILVADVAAVGGTSLSVGLINYDRTTVQSNTALVNGALTATMTPAGTKTVLVRGSTGAGGYIGTTTSTPGYFTALVAGTFTAGTIKVRVKYRGIGTITQ